MLENHKIKSWPRRAILSSLDSKNKIMIATAYKYRGLLQKYHESNNANVELHKQIQKCDKEVKRL
jgi:hypothetical protein